VCLGGRLGEGDPSPGTSSESPKRLGIAARAYPFARGTPEGVGLPPRDGSKQGQAGLSKPVEAHSGRVWRHVRRARAGGVAVPALVQHERLEPELGATAFETFSTLYWLLIAAATAPFILSWIIARGHKLTWAPGEVTMVVGITAFVLILCNGIILGRPGDSVDISLDIGYFVALLAAVGMAFCGYLRQAIYTEGRKPPGTL
jgi:hypothetical protein